MKIACDGTSKEVIYQHDGIRFAMQHRGYIYFYASEYFSSEEMMSFRYPLWRIDITKKQPKEELVYDPGVSSLMSGSYLIGIGNYVFFDMDTTGERNDTKQKVDLSDSAMRVEISDISLSTGVYDIHKGTIERIPLPILHPAWFNGDLYQTENLSISEDLDPWSLEALKRETIIKQISIDGTIQDTPVKAISSSFLHSDFSYLYVTAGTLPNFYKEEESWVKVYDKNFQLIDEFVLPETSYYLNDPPIGGEKYQYLLFEEEDTGEWGIAIWDKSELGTLHGKPYTQKKVVYKRENAPLIQ